jgi:hypothetical protein
MWLQKVVSRKRFGVGVLSTAAFFAAIWLLALNSPQYREARTVVGSTQLTAISGEVKATILLGFRVSNSEGQFSTISLFVIGERASGYLRISLGNGRDGPTVDSASFKGEALKLGGRSASL